ncbi:cytochrome C [Hydrogenophaga crassostreae]|uniref:Cytochrome C n=1 Tax=Hydrogenophaga crassostreae TaxID=1763535 RepID=A0A167HRZ6_9BURK|nr:cytochrome c [Hydrogenophaga crassostreae]AOW13373.1 cytochrome C [Hydrogenophaga crassostreae]OAD41657.1 cytochrome C [Hydrogenophaga crassostreae]
MKPTVTVLTVVLTIAVVAAAVVMIKKSDEKESPYRLHPDDASVVATGSKLYEMHCASCHGANLQGQSEWRTRGPDDLLPAPPHDASGHTWHHDDKTLFQITKLGVAKVIGDSTYKSAMPIYADTLSDQQIIAVLSWIKAQWPPEVRKNNDLVNTDQK